MDKADFSEQGAFRWIQKTSMDQRIPKKRLAPGHHLAKVRRSEAF